MQSVDLKKRRRAVKIANAVNRVLRVFLPLKVQNCCQTVGQTVK